MAEHNHEPQMVYAGPMDPERVIMWLGVELAEKKARIRDLEDEVNNTSAALQGALDRLRRIEEAGDRVDAGDDGH